MNIVELHVIYGNPDTEEWENVTYFIVDEYVPIDFGKGLDHVKQRQENDWRNVLLPNDEQVDIMVIRTGDQFTLNIRQDKIALSQTMCESLSSMCFRTLSGRDVNIQIHPEGKHKDISDYKHT